jgi:hypothetical protein
MNASTFDTEKAKLVETAVCSEFGTTLSEIVSFKDSLAKKVVVFVLFKILGYDKRILGHKYQMTYLYVPTVVLEMESMMKMVPGFELKINSVLKSVEYEKNLDGSRNRNFATAVSGL